ncbi:MAG TPA: cysteine desulfurase [Dehalococcoidia bacterium]|nr:cysteine desulfurase [Dehalococcoidia bacterium]
MLDSERIRADFPILARQVHGHPLVYLDNAATTQKPRQVIQSLVEFYEQHNANVHRGVHTLSQDATERYEAARAHAARFLGAGHDDEIVFTRGTTESINLVAQTWAHDNLDPGDEIVLTTAEHHSNLLPWQVVAQRRRAALRFIELDAEGRIDFDSATRVIGPRTRLVAVAQMSNVLGTIVPVRELAALAHARGALILVDGAQSAPHLPVNVQDLDCDFFACSAHKMLGPTGVGVLYARRAILKQMRPYQTGGSMIARVALEKSTYAPPPARFEAGTPNFADVAAFDAALDYLDAVGMEAVREHEQSLARYALERLGAAPGVTLFGPRNAGERGAVFGFNYRDFHPHDVGMILDHQGIAVRAGHHCAQPLMQVLDVPAVLRASFYLYNTPAEVDALVDALAAVDVLLGSREPAA